VTGTAVQSGTAVEFRGIRRSFGATHALDGLDLQLKPGELLALLGPSGCGKTTALRLLAGFDSPTAGEILIGGKDVTGALSSIPRRSCTPTSRACRPEAAGSS